MLWQKANEAVDAFGSVPHVALCFLGCGFIRGWLDILILAARATASPFAWLPAGVHVIMCLAEAVCFLTVGLLVRRSISLHESDAGLACCVGLPLVDGALMLASRTFGPDASDAVLTVGLVAAGAGYAIHLLLWLEAYGRLPTRLAVLAWAGSSVAGFLVWDVLEASTSVLSDALLFALPVLSIACALAAFRRLGANAADDASAPANASSTRAPLEVPWLLVAWVVTFAFLYGLADGRNGMAFSTWPSRVGMVAPSIVVIIGVMLLADRFDFKTLTIMAVACMSVGLLVVFVLQGSPTTSQVLISAANESYLMFAHMFACSLAYRLGRSAVELCGFVGAANIVSINVGMIAGSALSARLDDAWWASALVGAVGVGLAAAVSVAAVYNRDYLDSFTLRPDAASEEESRLLAIAQGYALSPKETAVFRLLARGLSAPAIAEELFCAPSTVRAHTSNIYRKMGIHTRAELDELLHA